MAQNARIKLTSTSLPKLGDVCDEIMTIGQKTGVKVKGPTPLPVKRLNVAWAQVEPIRPIRPSAI